MTDNLEADPIIDAPVKAKVATIILAAGKGTRMKSPLAKVLHPIHERKMLFYPVKLARDIGSERVIVIVGHQADLIRKTMENEELIFVHQEKQLGTGHAILLARNALQDFDGHVLILCGDVPLLLPPTVDALIRKHLENNASITVLTALQADPSGYGRIVKGEGNTVTKIVEERDATEDQRKIKEINTGIYCVECNFLFDAAGQIDDNNAQKEYYFTDIFEIACRRNLKAISLIIDDPAEAMGINTPADLERATRIMIEREQKRFLKKDGL